jgi:hypothetical protein
MRHLGQALALALTLCLSTSATGQTGWDNEEAARNGWSMEQNRSARWHLAQQTRMAAAIAALQPQRPGTVDAYVLSVGLDSDPVFGREAAEAGRVLVRRYGAAGRAIFLAAGADDKPVGTPQGSPPNIATALAAIAQKMNVKEDVLVLYATTHGDPRVGLVYRDGQDGIGMIAPKRLAALLDGLGFERRIILISACYSGVFVPLLANDDSIVITAASDTRTSFGCEPSNDWTFFGDALVNNALRTPQPLEKAAVEALTLISTWESTKGLTSSQPQVYLGDKAKQWLDGLEKRMPMQATAKVGRPAVDAPPLAAGR